MVAGAAASLPSHLRGFAASAAVVTSTSNVHLRPWPPTASPLLNLVRCLCAVLLLQSAPPALFSDRHGLQQDVQSRCSARVSAPTFELVRSIANPLWTAMQNPSKLHKYWQLSKVTANPHLSLQLPSLRRIQVLRKRLPLPLTESLPRHWQRNSPTGLFHRRQINTRPLLHTTRALAPPMMGLLQMPDSIPRLQRTMAKGPVHLRHPKWIRTSAAPPIHRTTIDHALRDLHHRTQQISIHSFVPPTAPEPALSPSMNSPRLLSTPTTPHLTPSPFER